jgi:hypothetical protein
MAVDTRRFEFFPSLDALPDDSARLWQAGASGSFFLSRGWFDCLISAGLDSGDTVALGALQSQDGRVLALLPGRFTAGSSRLLPTRQVRSLSGIYACLFRPILAPDTDQNEVARSLGRHFGASVAASDIVQLDTIDADWPALEAFERGLKDARFASARYDHFGSWFEAVAGRSFQQYLSMREGPIREIVRRRQRALSRKGARYEVLAAIQGIDEGIAAYEAVYARSWKQPEPYPRFHEHLMRSAARDGMLRLGFCYLGDRPIAVQLWILCHGRATVLKLAHDQEFDRLSPGSVLLAHMIRHLIEKDAAVEIDFGRGDDAYKRQWASRRRQRIGILAANPRSLAGLGVLTRQLAGRWLSSLRERSDSIR